jgi:hypothetical protein
MTWFSHCQTQTLEITQQSFSTANSVETPMCVLLYQQRSNLSQSLCVSPHLWNFLILLNKLLTKFIFLSSIPEYPSVLAIFHAWE